MDGNRPTLVSSRLWATLQRAGWFLSGMAVLAVCLLFRTWAPADSAAAKPPAGPVKKASATAPAKTPSTTVPATAASAPKKNPLAAIINNEQLTREELAQECLLHYGTEVLESVVNHNLIVAGCKARNIVISDEEVDKEINRLAAKFKLSREQWLKMLEKERGISADRYAKEVVWPTMALRALAKDQLTVSKKELDDAFDSEFGPAVKVRLIAIESADKARKIHAEAVAKPEDFGALAKKHSQDINSASAYGLIQPIRRHAGDAQLETEAFRLKKGEISKIVKVGELHVFLKCEEQLPAAKGVNRSQYEPQLEEAIKERKLRTAASDVFKQLQAGAKVENILNDPVKSKQMPGVAAVVNGQQIMLNQLAQECLVRHGKDVLEGTVNRRLLDQAMRRKSMKVTDADIEAEIGRAAVSMGKTKPNGEPDIQGWMEHITKAENITRDVYIRDEVWPSVALKKLVGDKVKITEEDLQRGYEANFGPKIQCRAIVLNNQRRAQEVWEKARAKPTLQYFGELAEQFSVEAGSKSLRGEVPPIQKNGGQPLLEKEAFSLSKENPLSGIVQVGSTFVILFFEGQTKPIKTSFAEVKELLYRDIHEKKQRLAMGKAFDEIKESAHVDNFLTGESKLPKRVEPTDNVAPGVAMPRVLKR